MELKLALPSMGAACCLLTRATSAAPLCSPPRLPKPYRINTVHQVQHLPSSKVILMMNLKMSLAKLL